MNVGGIVNLLTNDCQRLFETLVFFNFAWIAPLQFIIIVVILGFQLGYAIIPGNVTSIYLFRSKQDNIILLFIFFIIYFNLFILELYLLFIYLFIHFVSFYFLFCLFSILLIYFFITFSLI